MVYKTYIALDLSFSPDYGLQDIHSFRFVQIMVYKTYIALDLSFSPDYGLQDIHSFRFVF